MKAILIDPENRTISEIEYTGKFDGPNGAYEHLRCNIIQLAYNRDFPQGNFLLVDEEGSFKDKRFAFNLKAFTPPGMHGRFVELDHQFLLGRAITASDENDDDIGESSITIEMLQERIQWLGEIK
jgi:hypothetical protein